MNLLKKLWNWYHNKYLSQNYDTNVPLDKLKWLPKQLNPGKKEPFGFIDSIYFDIKRIPIKEEIVFEMENAQEVIKCAVRT